MHTWLFLPEKKHPPKYRSSRFMHSAGATALPDRLVISVLRDPGTEPIRRSAAGRTFGLLWPFAGHDRSAIFFFVPFDFGIRTGDWTSSRFGKTRRTGSWILSQVFGTVMVGKGQGQNKAATSMLMNKKQHTTSTRC